MENTIYTKQFDKDEFYNTPLIETKNFKVVPSLGAMVEGWLLIVPKRHYLSFAYIENELFEEFKTLQNEVVNLLEDIYKTNICVFENGAINCKSLVGCGVDYAHVHYVPLNINIKREISQSYNYTLEWEKIHGISELNQFIFLNAPYLYIQDNNKESFVAKIDSPRSQLIRQIIANKLGFPEKYDWKRFSFEDKIVNTINRIKSQNIEIKKSSYEFNHA
jgi:ATP adenylyltransferase